MASKDLESTEKKVTKKESLRNAFQFFGYLWRYRGIFLLSLLGMFVTAGLSLATPYFLGALIGNAKSSGVGIMAPLMQNRHTIVASLVGVLLLQAFIAYWRVRGFSSAGERALADIRKDLFDHLVGLPVAYYNEHRSGELSGRLTGDLGMIRELLMTTLPQLIRHLVMLIGGLIIIFMLSPRLAGFTLVVLPVVILLASVFGRKIRGLSREAQDEMAAANVVVEETVQAIASVKSFANEDFERTRHSRAVTGFLLSTLKAAKARAFFISFIIFVLFGAIATVAWFGAGMVERGEMQQAEFSQFILFAIFVGASIGAMPEVFGQISKGLGATERLRALRLETPENQTAEPIEMQGQLAFENVSFTYPSRPDQPVLSGVNFTAAAGERVAIVGPSGAGKSTLFQLLQGFYAPSQGDILIDGRSIEELPLKAMRRQMAIVPQDILLFGGSIFENILYGRPEATEAEVIDAAKQANAYDFIQAFPEKMETLVGPRGVKLSGGQRQRIAIARAILANPKILLLDEATSSLDSESERLVQEALERLMQGRTTLIVAHRLATVKNCHRILVLQQGKIVEQGAHEGLMLKERGVYRLLVETQML